MNLHESAEQSPVVPSWVGLIINAVASLVVIGAVLGLDLEDLGQKAQAIVVALPPVVILVRAAYEAWLRTVKNRSVGAPPLAGAEQLKAAAVTAGMSHDARRHLLPTSDQSVRAASPIFAGEMVVLDDDGRAVSANEHRVRAEYKARRAEPPKGAPHNP